jgi:hypothetical protein
MASPLLGISPFTHTRESKATVLHSTMVANPLGVKLLCTSSLLPLKRKTNGQTWN